MMTGGNGRDEADGGGEQRFGDARRDDGEVRRLRFRDADEAVHDAPYGAEQADERRRRADGGQHARTRVHVAAGRRREPVEPRSNALLDAHLVADVSGKAQFQRRHLDQPGDDAALPAEPLRSVRKGCSRINRPRGPLQSALGEGQLDRLREPDRPRDDGRERESDHHRLHDDVSGHEHVPRREIAREVRSIYALGRLSGFATGARPAVTQALVGLSGIDRSGTLHCRPLGGR